MRIVVITSCTDTKTAPPWVVRTYGLTQADFAQGAAHVARLEEERRRWCRPAEEMYAGEQHLRLMRAVTALRALLSTRGDLLELWIVSAGYGVIPAGRMLLPYEATFVGMRKADAQAWARKLMIPEQFRQVVSEPYDLCLVLLGDSYIRACELDLPVRWGGLTLILASQDAVSRIPTDHRVHLVVAGLTEADRFSSTGVALKGELGARILRLVVGSPEVIRRLGADKKDALSLLEGAPPSNPTVHGSIRIPTAWRTRPHRSKLRYFIPNWDDLVDPDYDFLREAHSGGTPAWRNEVYAHQLYPEPDYDGILLSREALKKSRYFREYNHAARGGGVHRFLRVPRSHSFSVMGDCGAWGYAGEPVPPYTTQEMVDYYDDLGFDYGVSIDHLITQRLKRDERERTHRRDLTLHNAKEFLREHRRQPRRWVPVGAVQGWDASSYADAARRTARMGYEYIGLGGLAMRASDEVKEVIGAVRAAISSQVQVHVFGVSRLEFIPTLLESGVDSIDSASALRKAWQDRSRNYLTPQGWYRAIRVPYVEASWDLGAEWELVRRDLAALGWRRSGSPARDDWEPRDARICDQTVLADLEQRCLSDLRGYASSGTVPFERLVKELALMETLYALMKAQRERDRSGEERRDWGADREAATVDPVRPRDVAMFQREIQRTLQDRPWEKCGCAVCSRVGVEVIILRGNNRNRRRGFHNTHIFTHLLDRMAGGERFSWLERHQRSVQVQLFSSDAMLGDKRTLQGPVSRPRYRRTPS